MKCQPGTACGFSSQKPLLLMRNKRVFRLYPVLFLFFFFLTGTVFSAEKGTGIRPIELSHNNDMYYIGLNGQYLEDPRGELSLEQVISGQYDKKFTFINEKIKNIGYTGSVYWIRFKAVNRDMANSEWWLNVQQVWARNIDVFIRYNDRTLHRKAGVNFPFWQREIHLNDFIFSIFLEEAEPVWVYIRISASSLQLNITLSSPGKYIEEYSLRELTNGFYYGLIFIMAIYNLMIFLSIRDRSYLYYALYLVFMGLFLLSNNGYAFAYLWPGVKETGISVYFIFAALLQILGILLSVNFLDMGKNFPKMYRVMQMLSLAPAGVIVMFFFPEMRESIFLRPFTAMSAGVIIFLSFIISLISFKKGFRPARYYMIAWIFLFAGVMVFLMKQFGFIPENILFEYGIHIGNTFELAFISLALTDRIRLIRREKVAAQLRALESQRVLAEELEEKVLERTEKLQQSEVRFRALADATFEGIVISRQRKIIDCNYALQDLTGFTAQELTGKSITALFTARDNSVFKQILRSGCSYPLEILMKTRKGKYIPVEILGRNITQSGKKILIIAVRDIRERKKNQRMKENVERVIRHDLKGPLSSIIKFANQLVLQKGVLKNKKQTKIPRFILKNSLQMNEKINQSLDLFKMEEGIYHVEVRELDLISLLQGIESDFSFMKRSSRVDIILFLNGKKITGGDTYPVLGEENKLRTLFSNLVRNGIEASTRGGRVTISVSRGRLYHNIIIHNQGTIPAEIKGRIFEPYVISGKPGGRGLGIYSARIIAVSHRGDVSFTTSKKGGTTFTVRLPLRI